MIARGQLRHHAAIVGVHRDLGVQRMSQQPCACAVLPVLVQRDAGLVAGGLDTEYQHRA